MSMDIAFVMHIVVLHCTANIKTFVAFFTKKKLSLLMAHVWTYAHVKVLAIYYFISTQGYSSEEQMFCVYVPTNHLYIGDIFLVSSNDVIRPNISVREGIGMPRLYFLSFLTVMFIFRQVPSEWLLYKKTTFCRNCCLRGHVNASSVVNLGKRAEPVEQDPINQKLR